MITACLFSLNSIKAQDLIITGAFDGPLSGGVPKFVEVYVINNVTDLSIYGLGSANNGGGTDGEEFTFAAVSATAGDFIYVASDSSGFYDYFGFNADYPNISAMGINGDDAIELFMNGTVVDVFGDINTDGTGQSWDYLDGWAYRNNGGTISTTFVSTDWNYSGTNTTDGCTTNATCSSVFPIGTYQHVAVPTMNIETPTFTMNEGDATTIVTRFIIDPAATAAGTYEIHLVGGTGTAADLDLTAFMQTSFPLTLPIASGNDTLTVPITPNDDLIYEGTETFEFVIRNSSVNLGSDTTFTLTMTDNETPPDTLVNFNPTTVTANEGDGTVDLTLEIGQLSSTGTTFTVDVALLSGDVSDVNNYTTQTVSFNPTGTTTQTLSLTITDDALVEGNETLTFLLTNPSAGLTLGTDSIVTLTITDNDAPSYTIADITTLDANGEPDSIGVYVELNNVVVMGINYATLPAVSFYFHDGTGGMGLYSSNDFGYTVNEGDLITVRGEVGFYNGLTQLVNLDTIFTTGTSTLPAVTTVTSLDETTESELVKLENVTVVDQTDWDNSNSSGFNVDVTDGTTTFSIRVDNATDLYNMAIPGCVLDITGIGSQFDSSSPYDDGYQLYVRYAADISVITACNAVTPTTVTIADATEVDTNGDPVMWNDVVELRGIITSPDFRETQDGTEFTFSDGTGGIWAYSSDSSITFDPEVGDSVVVYGEIGISSGANRIYIDSVFNLGAATPFTPTVVSVELAEEHEAELITLENLTLTSDWDFSGGSFNVSATGNGTTYDIRVDADRTELFTQLLSNGDIFNITGVGAQYDATAPRDEGYQLMPRFTTDIEKVSAIKEISLNNFVVSPVPATDILNITFDFDKNEEATIRLVNVIGKVVAQQNTSLIKGTNTNTINVANLNAGFYVLQIQTSNGVSNTNVLVK